MTHIIAPSLLASDFLHLEEEVKMVNESIADWIHIDVMDGVFVPNISYGQRIVRMIAGVAKLPLDVHLMIVHPEKYIEQFRECGAEIITVHLEACVHLHRVIHQIKSTGAKAGVALNPHSSVRLIEDVLEDLDLILIMSVNPGFGGQKFIYQSLQKVKQLKTMLVERNLSPLIEIDGGIGLHNAEACLNAGVNVLVAGSSIFKSDNPHDTIRRMKSIHTDTFQI